MGSDYIHQEARRLVRRCGTRDPFQIAKELGIHVVYSYEFNALKGMYKVIKRSRFIFINGNLSRRDRKMVCAHELGHDRFHRHFARASALQEFMLYDMKSRPEYEANIFAGELLIGDDDMLSLIEQECDIYQMASALGEDMNLVLIKLDELRKKGHELRTIDRPPSDFLGRH